MLSTNRTPDSYLAGGAALHIDPRSKRYSSDLDYFHDSEARVAREQPDLVALKTTWLAALDDAEAFISSRPPEEVGCLYYSLAKERFVDRFGSDDDVRTHHGRPGGVLPRIDDER